jgi:hypothetical protein
MSVVLAFIVIDKKEIKMFSKYFLILGLEFSFDKKFFCFQKHFSIFKKKTKISPTLFLPLPYVLRLIFDMFV